MTFPLGVPVNRPAPKGLVPVPGRPGWWRHPDGVERYVEPPKPSQGEDDDFIWPYCDDEL